MRRTLSVMMATCLLTISAHAQPQSSQEVVGFGSFQDETERFRLAIPCYAPRVTAPMAGYGGLWGCVQGRAETAKVFINQMRNDRAVVQDIKVVWNEYTRNIGEGLAADRTEAQRMASVAADLYAPKTKPRILEAFMGRRNTTFTEGPFRIEYRYSPGPAAAEHLLTITVRQRSQT